MFKYEGTIGQIIQKGIDNLSEASVVFNQNNLLLAEGAICYLEQGWLYLLQYESGDENIDKTALEQSITYLEKSIFLNQKLQKRYDDSSTDRTRPYDPQDPTKYPKHITLLTGGKPYPGADGLLGKPFAYFEGISMFLLGKSYSLLSNDTYNQETALDYFNKCLKPKYLLVQSEYFVDAHYLSANLIIRNPGIVNPDYGKAIAGQGANSILHLDSAIYHLEVASNSSFAANKLTDLRFLTAQV